jgi:opacity protein-like surface antigen
MKKILVISTVAALGLSAAALAGGLPETMPLAPVSSSDMGLYVGLNGGFGMTNWKNKEGMTTKISKDNGFVSRVFVGADLNKYFAAEFGYAWFFNKPKMNDNAYMKNTMAFDLMGKIKAPVADNLDLYGKVGVNYLMTHGDTSTKNAKNFNVAFGAGADYYITPNVIVNVEWLRYNGKAKFSDSEYQPHTDAFLLGLRYKFDI